MRDQSSVSNKRVSLELVLPVLIILVIGLGWYVAKNYEKTVEAAVISSYQETQLEIVRAVARSAELYLADELAKGTDRQTIEQTILRRFVTPVHLREQGDAWIYAPDHIVFDLSEDVPEEYKGKSMAQIFAIQVKQGASHYEAMTDDVMNAREGVGWYVWLPDKGREIAAWTPVKLGDHVWTIGLSTPLSEILEATGATSQSRFVSLAMLIATIIGLGLTALATRSMLVQRRTQDAIRESEDKYRTLFETATDGILILSLEGAITDANPAACAMYERSRDDLRGVEAVSLFQSDYRAAVVDFVKSAADENPFRAHVQGVRQDGELIEAELSGRAYNLHGEEHVLLNVRDLTARTQAERDKEELEAKLARSKKMEALGLLAGGVAHDLNNILGGIVSYPDMLVAELDPPEGSDVHDMLETIKDSGARAAAVVADLMTVAKGAASQHEVLSLNDVVNEYLLSGESRELKRRFPSVRLETRLEDALPPIKGGFVSLKQSIINLALNAAEAIHGEGVVRIATHHERVTEPISGYNDVPVGEYAVVCVSDDGTGIAPGDLERIFEPFYTRKQMGRSGTGLGLAIVWNAVQDCNGHVDLRSDASGTMFDLYFPISREGLPAKKVKTPKAKLIGNGETILIVDDESRQRTIACRMLESLGYEPSAVASGEEAIDYMKSHSVDLIVLDMIMEPGIDGRQTYEQIVKERPGQKAIIASGYAESDDVRMAQTLGAGEYLKKPYTLEDLGKSVLLELRK